MNIEFMDESLGFQSKVEDELEQAVCTALESNADQRDKIQNRQVYEQISEERHEILRWYPFKPDATILEVGAGMGAVTGILLEKAKELTCLEKKESRCSILKQRFADCKNIQVYHTNFVDFVPEKKYDYVIVHEITGYAKKYFKDDMAYSKFFLKLKSFLAPSGTLLVLVENRLGLKYFSGAYEEYSSKFFVGLNNFDGYNYIKTFTRNELMSMGKQAGFTHCRAYYPYPDLVFPVNIYTDEALEKMYYGAHEAPYAKDRFVFFDEQRMFYTLQKEGIIHKFVNAFVMEFSMEEQENTVLYYRVIDAGAGERQYECLQKLFHGIRADRYVIDLLEVLVSGMLESSNDKIEEIHTFFVKSMERISKEDKLFTIQDIYVDGDNIYLRAQNGIVLNEYMAYKECWFLYDFYKFYIRGRRDYEKWLPFDRLCKKCGVTSERMGQYLQVRSSNSSNGVSHYGRKYYSNLIYPIDIYQNGDLIMDDLRVHEDEEEKLLMREEQLLESMRKNK